MAPKSFQGAWKRPATRIYNDNYRFGNSLYSGAVADLDKRTSDRPALLRTYSPPPMMSVDPGVRRAVLEADLGIAGYSNSELHRSLSANRLNELGLTANYKQVTQETTTSTSNANRGVESFSTYASAKALANVEAELEESRARRRRQRAALIRPESAYYADELPTMQDPEIHTQTTSPFWMERWYNKSVRSVRHGVFPL